MAQIFKLFHKLLFLTPPNPYIAKSKMSVAGHHSLSTATTYPVSLTLYSSRFQQRHPLLLCFSPVLYATDDDIIKSFETGTELNFGTIEKPEPMHFFFAAALPERMHHIAASVQELVLTL